MSSTIDNEVMSESSGEFAPLQGGLRWHSSAPESVAAAGTWDNDSEGWKLWAKHLSRRDGPKALARVFKHYDLPKSPLDDDPSDATLTACLEEATSPVLREQAEQWLAVARELPKLSARVSARLWWRTVEHLLNMRLWAESQDWQHDVVAGQLLLAELPITLAHVLPEFDNTRWLVPGAIEHVRASMAELLDGQGLPHVGHLNDFRPLIACWSRVAVMSRWLERADWTDEMRKEMSAATTHLLRLTRRDGSQVLGADNAPSRSRLRWIEEAADEFGTGKSKRLAAFVLRHHGKVPSKSPSPADHSEWSEVATLRTDWTRRAHRLAVDYSGRRIRAELDAAGELIFAGDWTFEVQFNGQVLEPQSDWEEVCWESDEEVDYLELQTTLPQGMHMQRQFMLSRSDEILVMADAVLGVEPGEIEYRASYPLAAGIHFEGAAESREGFLVGKKRRALVMPLAMPEWRTDPRGTLHVSDGKLEVVQSVSKSRSLFAPLFFDLRSRRFEKRRTWRRLTVGEERAIAGPDVAVGYRAQVGKSQWLVFRSLQEGRSRTVLGHHLFSEFLVGRFSSEGTVESLIEIE